MSAADALILAMPLLLSARMAKKTQPVSPARAADIPAEIRAILGSPPGNRLADAVEYERLLVAIAHALGARDAIDWLLAQQACICILKQRSLEKIRDSLLVSAETAARERLAQKSWRRMLLSMSDDLYIRMKDGQAKARLKELILRASGSYQDGMGEDYHLFRLASEFDGFERVPPEDSVIQRAYHLRRVTADDVMAEAQKSSSEILESLEIAIGQSQKSFERILQEADRRKLVSAKLREMAFLAGDVEPSEASLQHDNGDRRGNLIEARKESRDSASD